MRFVWPSKWTNASSIVTQWAPTCDKGTIEERIACFHQRIKAPTSRATFVWRAGSGSNTNMKNYSRRLLTRRRSEKMRSISILASKRFADWKDRNFLEVKSNVSPLQEHWLRIRRFWSSTRPRQPLMNKVRKLSNKLSIKQWKAGHQSWSPIECQRFRSAIGLLSCTKVALSKMAPLTSFRKNLMVILLN